MGIGKLHIDTSEAIVPSLTCTLNCRELQERKETIFAELNKKRISKTELTNGYCFEFAMNEETEKQISFFIQKEKECCDFLQFQVTKDNNGKIIKLQIEGPGTVKSFIDTNMNI